MKAFILAAGFGSRLRPITDQIPKPLCPFFGIPIFDLVFHQIQRAGISEIACNSHHLSNAIENHLLRSPVIHGRQVFHSQEPEIRGTGGSLYPIRDWLGPAADLLIYNGDILCDMDLESAIRAHQEGGHDATMVLLSEPSPDKTAVYLDAKGQILQFGGPKPSGAVSAHTFTGIHIVSSEFARDIPSDLPWSVIDTYLSRMAASKPIKGYILPSNTIWHDMGTHHSYWLSHMDLLADPKREQRFLDLGLRDCQRLYKLEFDYITERLCALPSQCTHQLDINRIYKTVVLSQQSQLAAGAELDHCLVLPGINVIDQSYSHHIITPSHQIDMLA